MANGRRMLVEPIVIAGDRAGPNVALYSNFRVAQVGQVHGFRAFAHGAVFQFHEIADARAAL